MEGWGWRGSEDSSPSSTPFPPSTLYETANHSYQWWIQLQQLQRGKHLFAGGWAPPNHQAALTHALGPTFPLI